MVSATIFGMAFGGYFSGVIFDLTSSYRMAFLNGVLWNAFNVAIVNNTMTHIIGPKPGDVSQWAASDSSGIIMLSVNHISVMNNRINDVAGTGVELNVWMGMPHGFQASVGRLKAAAESLDAIGAFLAGKLKEQANS